MLERMLTANSRRPILVFHHQIIWADIVNLADVGMIQRGDRFGFALEPFPELCAGNFDRDCPIQTRVFGTIRFSHRTRADGRKDLVRAEFAPAESGMGATELSRFTKRVGWEGIRGRPEVVVDEISHHRRSLQGLLGDHASPPARGRPVLQIHNPNPASAKMKRLSCVRRWLGCCGPSSTSSST